MNLLDAEDMIKSLPDQALMQQAQMPTGEIPQFLVISEIKNRADMRKRYEAQLKEQPQGTVAEQVMREGIAGMMPQQGVTPQMGQQPPQVGPQMPPQGMPPQGGPQGMPPQGMPPQGMPPQMPPQGGPQGMPSQMPPQGMPPQGMPPGMPPMGMAAGGIVRMRNGGLTGMPGENALAGMQAELEAKAKVLAATTGRSFNEILETLVREAQMNMPDYSMVGRTGTGEISDMIAGARSAMGDTYDSVIREAQMNMPDYGMITRAGMGELPSMPSGTRPPKAVSSGVDLGALGDIDSAVGSGIQDVYGMVPSSSSTGIADRISALTDELGITGVDRDAKRRARIEKNLQESEGFRQKPGTESADPLSGMLELAQEAYTDASSPQRRRGRQPVVQGDSPSGIAQRRRGLQGEPSLNAFSDTALGRGIGSVSNFLGQAGDYIADDVRRSVAPIRAYEAGRSQRVSDALDEGGYGAGIGQLLREAPGSVENVLRTAFTDFANLPPITGAANMLDQLVTGSTNDPILLSDIGGFFSGQDEPDPIAQGNKNNSQKQGTGKNRAGNTYDFLGSPFPTRPDAPSGEDNATTDVRRALTESADPRGGQAPEAAERARAAFDRDTSLDFSDLIEDSKRMARANALMQLGAGIASGDTAKALSAAGTAATKGMQDARTLDMRARLADYQAGREDLRRGEEAERFERKLTSQESQFDKQLDQLERKIDASINVSDATSQRSILRALSEEVSSLREQSNIMTDPEKARFKTLESALYQMMGLDLSAPNVTGGLSGKDLSGLSALLN